MNKKLLLIPVLFLLLVGFVSAIPSGGLAYWAGDNNLSDSWNSYNLTNSGGTYNNSYASGNTSGTGSPASFRFEDPADHVYRSDGVDDLDFGTGDFTVALWIRPETGTNGQQLRIIGKDDNGGAGATGFFVQKTTLNKIMFATRNHTEGYGIYPLGSISIAEGVWQHLIFTRESNVLKSWVDCTADINTPEDDVTDINNAAPFRIGLMDTAGADGFEGNIDDVKVFNRALTSDERSDLCKYMEIQGTPTFDITNTNSLNNITAYIYDFAEPTISTIGTYTNLAYANDSDFNTKATGGLLVTGNYIYSNHTKTINTSSDIGVKYKLAATHSQGVLSCYNSTDWETIEYYAGTGSIVEKVTTIPNSCLDENIIQLRYGAAPSGLSSFYEDQLIWNYSTINGTINTGIDDDNEFNIIMQSNEGYYFNYSYTDYNISNDLEVTFIEYPRVTLYNNFSLDSLSGFNVTYSSFLTPLGTISDIGGIAYIPSNQSGGSSVTIQKEGYITRENIKHNFTNSNNLNTSLYQSIVNISINESYSGNPISDWVLYNGSTILINTSIDSGIFYGGIGEFDGLVLHSNTGSFSDRNLDSFNVSALDNISINFELLPTELNITTFDILTSDAIDNFSITYSSLNNSHSGSYSTTDGDIVFGVIDGDTYNITVEADDYAHYNNTYLKTISGNSNHSFYLYTDNSINFTIRWENNGSLVTGLVNISITGADATYNFSTSNGTLYADDLIDSVYSVKASYTGINDKYYSVTVYNRSHQDLGIYLSTGYENVTFLFQDKNTGEALEGVYFSMSRYVNSTLTVVSSKLSDITGTVNANYVDGVYYLISSSKTGYSVKSFELDTIESELYIVKMDPSTSQIYISSGVTVYYDHSTFSNGTNNLSFTINSPLGLLSSYWLNVSYPDSYSYYSGSDSNGEVFDFSFNITDPEIFDVVTVEYTYVTSLGVTVNKVFYHPISFVNSSSQSWVNMGSGFEDLGIFERIMLVILCVILVAGFGYLIAGFGGSLALGLLTYVFFVAAGFIPLWTIIISLLVGGILIFKGGIFG